MAFGWLTMARRSNWIAFRKFVLEEKQDVPKRISEITKELELNGRIVVLYEKNDNTKKNSQRRKRFLVTRGSSLEKLVKVYISMGGNPLDISMFISPNSLEVVREDGQTYFEFTAMGGVVAPYSGSPDEMVYTGGWLNWNKDPKWSIGNAELPMQKQHWTQHTVKKSRGWVEKEIRTKRNKIEEKIIKLCDLAEQLTNEKKLLELRTREFSPLNKINNWSIQQSVEYPIHLVDKVFWRQTDGVNGDPNDPRILARDQINQTQEEVLADEDIRIRAEHPQFFEDPLGEEYPITSL